MTCKSILRRVGRTLLLYGWFAGLSACMAIIFGSSFPTQYRSVLGEGADLVIRIGAAVLSLLACHSCMRQFAMNDSERYGALAAAGDMTDPGWRRAAAAAWRTPSFLCEAIVLTALVLALPPAVGWIGFASLSAWYLPLPAAPRRVLLGVVIALIVNAFHLFAYVSAVKNWRLDAKTREMMGGTTVGRRRMMAPGWRRLLLYGAFVTIGYLLFSAILLWVAFLVGSLAVTVARALSWQFAVVLLCLLLLLTGHRYLRALRAVRRFKRDLKKVCREGGYTCSDISHLYRSVLTGRRCGTFTVLAGGKRYACCVISAVRRGNRMFLDGEACIHDCDVRLFRRTLFHYYHTTPFTFPDAGERIVIAHPTANSMIAQKDGTVREVVTGDRIGDYTLYNAKNFLGCLSRDCLGGRN